MSQAAGLLLLAFLVTSGCALVRLLLGRLPPLPLGLALGHLSGTALAALGVTAGMAATDQAHPAAALVPGGVVLLAAMIRRGGPENPRPSGGSPAHRWDRALAGLLAIGIATAAARVAMLPLDWDGWAFWQLKARALADGSLRDLLQDPLYRYGHPDYPLLNPVHTWLLSGFGFHEKASQAGGFLFLLDLLAIFHAAARERAPSPWPLSGCVAIVSWAVTMKHSASGFSDLILAAYVLAVAAPLARGEWRLAGPMLIGAALTKNEGLFTLAGVLACWAMAEKPARLRAAAVPAAGACALALWWVVKRRWGLYADLLDPAQWSPAIVQELPRRAVVIVEGIGRQFLAAGPWYPGWGAAWLLCLAGLWTTLARRAGGLFPLWAIVGAHFAGAAAAYLVTGADAALHLDRSLDRLLLHVAPAALLAGIISVGGEAQAPDGADPTDRFDAPAVVNPARPTQPSATARRGS